MAETIRVLCVDDHRVVLEGLSPTSGEQAVEMFRRLQPDVTLMDLRLPAMSGHEAIRTICEESPEARIVVLTMYHGDEDVNQALDAGAATYLLKDTLSEDLVRVIRDVHGGERPIPSNVAALLDARKTQPSLTPREVEVVSLIAEGMRNKEIAVALGISEETAKVHVKNILAKLNVSDRAAVIPVALRRGIIHLE
jgi:two-component system NarL family response regulator